MILEDQKQIINKAEHYMRIILHQIVPDELFINSVNIEIINLKGLRFDRHQIVIYYDTEQGYFFVKENIPDGKKVLITHDQALHLIIIKAIKDYMYTRRYKLLKYFGMEK